MEQGQSLSEEGKCKLTVALGLTSKSVFVFAHSAVSFQERKWSEWWQEKASHKDYHRALHRGIQIWLQAILLISYEYVYKRVS